MSWREGEERRAFLISKWEALEREEKRLEEGRCELQAVLLLDCMLPGMVVFRLRRRMSPG